MESDAKNRIDAKIAAWLDASLDDVRDAVAVDEHIDYVLGEAISQERTIEASLLAFSYLLQRVLEQRAPVIPALFIRLRSLSNKMTLATPADLQAVKEQWREIEPPSLVLLGRHYRSYLPFVEEYRCPLRFSLFTPPVEGVVSYYSESKTADDEDEDDFDRAIYVIYNSERGDAGDRSDNGGN